MTRPLSALLALACLVSPAVAQVEGGLDPSFGGTGRAATVVLGGGRSEAVGGMADGSVVVAGGHSYAGSNRIVLARFRPDGSLDPSFGNLPEEPGRSAFDFPAVQPGAAAVRAMAAMQGGDNGAMYVLADWRASSPDTYGAAVLRVDQSGRLDPQFHGSGYVLLPANVGMFPRTGIAMVATADGGVVVLSIDTAVAGQLRKVLRRWRADGSLDSNFGSGGELPLTATLALESHSMMAAASDGSLYLLAYVVPATSLVPGVIHVMANGVVDTAYGSGAGYAVLDANSSSVPVALAVQDDGRAIGMVQKSVPTPYGLLGMCSMSRLQAAGAADVSFGQTGVVSVGAYDGTSAYCRGVVPRNRLEAWMLLDRMGVLGYPFSLVDGHIQSTFNVPRFDAWNGAPMAKDAQQRLLVPTNVGGMGVERRWVDRIFSASLEPGS